jgi:hypothetical protein
MRFRAIGLALATFCLIGAHPLVASARKVEDIYAKQVVFLKKRPPFKFKSKKAFLNFLSSKRMAKRRRKPADVWPVKKGGRTWKIQYMAFFKRPINDREVKLRFYDITSGREYVAGDSLFTRMGQRIVSSSLELTDDQGFQINRKYQLYVLGRGNVSLANTTFWLRGRPEVYSGKVTFSDEDAKLNKR